MWLCYTLITQLTTGGQLDKDGILKAFSSFLDNFGGSIKNTTSGISPEMIPVIKAVDDDLMQAIEVVYEPDAVDCHGDWMSASTIRKACDNFNENLVKGNLKPNLFHIKETDKFTIEKSWINEVDSVIGDTLIPEGTWLVKVQYNDVNLWKQKKDGTIQGVSIGAKGKRHDPKHPKLHEQAPEVVEVAVDKAASAAASQAINTTINGAVKSAKIKHKVRVLPKNTSPHNDDQEQPSIPKRKPQLATD